jgi:predicted ester cyclase
MRRSPAWPVTVLLAAAAGAVLAATSGTLTTPGVGDPRGAAAAATVRAFYDRVNDVLRTGDAASLGGSVAPDFVEHAAAPGLAPTRDGLARALVDLRATYPALRIVPEDVAATGDRVFARVRVEGAADGRFLGLPLGGASVPWGPVDLFRVAGDRVVEHWGIAAGARFEPLGTVPLGSLSGTPQIFTLARWTLPTKTRLAITAGEGRHLLAAATGELTVTIVASPGESALVTTGIGGEPTPVVPGTALTLALGATLTVSGATSYVIANDADGEAAAVAVDVLPPGGGELDTVRYSPIYAPPAIAADATGVTVFPGGVTMRPLARSRMLFLPADPADLALARVTLAPAEALPPKRPAGPVLVAVEAGKLDVDTGPGRAWVRRGASGASNEAASPSLEAGDGAFVPAGTDLGLGNYTTGLVNALVVTIMPTAA